MAPTEGRVHIKLNMNLYVNWHQQHRKQDLMIHTQ